MLHGPLEIWSLVRSIDLVTNLSALVMIFFSFESLGHYNFFYHQMHVLFFVIILIISRFLPTVPFQVWSPEADEEQEQQ